MVLRLKDEASKTLDSAGKEAKSAGIPIKALAGIAAATAASMGILAQTMANLKNEISDLSLRTGLQNTTLAGLRLAAKGSGQELSTLASSLQQFPKRMADFARDTGEAKVAFEALGISVTDAAGNLRSADDVLRETLTALSAVADPTEQAALATIAFGEAGGALLQALGDPGNLDHFVEQAKLFGVDVGPAAAASADRWERSIAALMTTLQGAADLFLQTLGGEDGLRGLIDDLTVGITFWARVFVGAISTVTTQLGSFARFWLNIFEAMRAGFVASIEQILDNMRNLVEVIQLVLAGDFKGAASALGGIGAATVENVLAPFVSDVDSAINDVLDATIENISNVGSILSNAASAADKAFVSLNKVLPGGGGGGGGGISLTAEGDPVQDLAAEFAKGFRIMLAAAKPALDKTAESLAALDAVVQELTITDQRWLELRRGLVRLQAADTARDVQGALQAPTAALAATGPIGAIVATIFELFSSKEGFKGLLDGISDLILGLLEALPDIIGEVIPEWITSLLTGIIEMLPEFVTALLTEAIPALIQGIIELWPALIAALPDLVLGILEALIRAIPILIIELLLIFPKMIAAIIDGIAGIFGKGDGEGGGLLGGITKFFGGITGFLKGGNRASGGFVSQTGLALVHEGDRFTTDQGLGAQSMGGRNGGGSNIQISGVFGADAADDIARVLDQRFGTFGGGNSETVG